MGLPGSQHPTYGLRFSQASLVSFALRRSEADDCSDRRRAHPEDFGVWILDLDPDWKTLSNPHPVKVSFYKWQALDLDIVFLGLHRGRDPFDDSLKTPIRIRQEIYLGSHAGKYAS